MSWTSLKNGIATVIKTNGNQEITGNALQGVLNSMVNALGAHATFAGFAIPSTSPGTPDGPVFYFAFQEGSYSNFGATPFVISEGEFGIFVWNGTTWNTVKYTAGLSEIVSELNDLGSKTTQVVFTESEKFNKIIRKLFIDTSGYTGSKSLNGLRVASISKNAEGYYGVRLENENGDYFNFYYAGGDAFGNVTNAGIFLYMEFNWENQTSTYLFPETGKPGLLTTEAFNPLYDPRISRIINTDSIADGAITAAKIGNGAVSTAKIANNAVTTNKIGDGAISASKLDTDLKLFYDANTIFKTSSSALAREVWNKAVVKLYIDTSGYTGDASDLEGGFKFTNFNMGTWQENLSKYYFGCRVELVSKSSVANNFYIAVNSQADAPKNQEITLSGIYIYVEYNWNNLGARIGTANWGSVNPDLAICQNPNNDPRGSVDGSDISDGTIPASKMVTSVQTSLAQIPTNTDAITALTSRIASLESAVISNSSNRLYGKILCSVGDSITYGADMDSEGIVDESSITMYQWTNSSQTWPQKTSQFLKTYGYQIAERNGMTFYNGGISGSTMQGLSDKWGFSLENGRYTKLPDNIDYLTIFFGWNDAAYGTLGTINDSTNESYYGGYNVVLPYLINKYPFTKIVLIVPFGTTDGHRQAIRDLANKWGVACFDMFQGGTPLYYNKETSVGVNSSIVTSNRAKFQANGAHPNFKGHRQIADMLEHFLRGV